MKITKRKKPAKAVPWSDRDLYLLRLAYSKAGAPPTLDALAKKLGRNKANVCRKARSLGLTDQRRPKSAQATIVFPRMTREEQSANTGRVIREYIAKNGHPRGALGMKHTDETKTAQAARSKAMWRDPLHKINSEEHRQRRSDHMIKRVVDGTLKQRGYSRARGGKREDLGSLYFRSRWEANYARYLNLLKSQSKIAGWEYEPKVFVFERISRGTRAYTPDFKVIFADGRHEWHEVKGWMDPKSKTRLSRMARYFPEEKLVVIDQSWFKQAKRNGLDGVIANWERM